MCVWGGRQGSGNPLWQLGGWHSAGRCRLKSLSRGRTGNRGWDWWISWHCYRVQSPSQFVSVYVCVCMCVCDLILHLSLCFLLTGLSSFLLSLLLSAYPSSVCLRPLIDLCVAASLRQLMWLSPLAFYPTLKVLNNSSGSAAGLWTAQISVRGGWVGHSGTVTSSPTAWGWAVSSCPFELVSPCMAQASYKAELLWPGALLNLA